MPRVHRRDSADQTDLVNALVYRGTTPASSIVHAHLSKYAPLQADAAIYERQPLFARVVQDGRHAATS